MNQVLHVVRWKSFRGSLAPCVGYFSVRRCVASFSDMSCHFETNGLGIPYLYRVGLVLINCLRHLLLQAKTEEAALAHLAHPPPACLPSATELLALAANVKLRDDDVRKQRIKMEQQLKRTTQARPPNGMTNVQTATISLPKT